MEKRPIVIIVLGAICGIILPNILSIKIQIIITISIVALIILLKILKIRIKNIYYKNLFCRVNRYIKVIFDKKCLTLFIIPLIVFSIYVLILNNAYEKFYKQVETEIEMEAVIVSNKTEKEYYNSYIAKGTKGIFKNKRFIIYIKKNINLDYSNKVIIQGTFIRPNEARNYKGFNYKKYLQTNKIYGTIKTSSVKLVSKNNINTILEINNKIRNKIIKQIQNILPTETNGLLIGLLLGDNSYMQEETVEYFRKSSLAHMLAVSGAHVSYIILGLTYFATINKMNKKCGYLLTIFALIVIIFITNFSVSVIRASIMAIILIFSKIIYRKADIKNTLAISLLIILIENPYNIMSLSLQLSYLGTIGVIFITPIIYKIINKYIKFKFKYKEKLFKAISVSASAQIMILPIMVINFNTISFTFLISNLIASPLFGMAIIYGIILILISFIALNIAEPLGVLLNVNLKALILISKFCSKLKLSNIYVITPRTITVIIYYILIVLTSYILTLKFSNNLKPRKIKFLKKIQKLNHKKIILILIVFIIIIEIPYKNYNGKLKIYFIDVGQRR